MSRRRGRRSAGPPTECICPVCGKKTAKPVGTPCRTMNCPECGNPMVRGNSSQLASSKKTTNTTKTDIENASKILRNISYKNAFYFFTGIGEYAGEFASSLADFCNKIQTIDTKSVDFHFKRRDFEKWIRKTVGDTQLANEIKKIPKSLQGEKLRSRIYQTTNKRLTELKKILASKTKYLEKM